MTDLQLLLDIRTELNKVVQHGKCTGTDCPGCRCGMLVGRIDRAIADHYKKKAAEPMANHTSMDTVHDVARVIDGMSKPGIRWTPLSVAMELANRGLLVHDIETTDKEPNH